MEVMILNSKLPARAGRAELYFASRDKTPVRNKGLIGLPLHPEAKFYPLQHGEQFLFSTPLSENDRYGGHARQDTLWFGGTDEEPFLVRLHPGLLKDFEADGEEGFFEALKPGLIEDMEPIFGWATKRQGDIFALRTPFTWKMLKALHVIQNPGKSSELKEVKAESVFETRHRFTGVGLRVSLATSVESIPFVEGLLQAPDHADLTLKGIYVLAQSEGLFTPKLAD